MDAFKAENVELFLRYLADVKGNCAATVNCRLAAMKAFSGYAACRMPERLFQMRRICDLSRRREKRGEVNYLTMEEIGWIKAECVIVTEHLMVFVVRQHGRSHKRARNAASLRFLLL